MDHDINETFYFRFINNKIVIKQTRKRNKLNKDRNNF